MESESAIAFDVFEQASPALLACLEAAGETKTYPAPGVVIAEGRSAEGLLIVTAGRLDVATQMATGEMLPLGHGERGALFGEMSWLEQRPAVATVTATAGSSVLVLPQPTLEQLQRTAPEMAAQLLQLIGAKLSRQIKAQNAWVHRFTSSQQEPLRKVLVLFAELDEQDVDWLRRIGRLQRLAAGEVLIEQGAAVPALSLVLAGEASIEVERNGRHHAVGSSRRGEVLGEMTLFDQEAAGASARVVARTGLELLNLDKTELLAALATSGQRATRFWRALARMLSQRSRDQLLERGLAAASRRAEAEAPEDELDVAALSAITTAGSRFDWLCRQFQDQGG